MATVIPTTRYSLEMRNTAPVVVSVLSLNVRKKEQLGFHPTGECESIVGRDVGGRELSREVNCYSLAPYKDGSQAVSLYADDRRVQSDDSAVGTPFSSAEARNSIFVRSEQKPTKFWLRFKVGQYPEERVNLKFEDFLDVHREKESQPVDFRVEFFNPRKILPAESSDSYSCVLSAYMTFPEQNETYIIVMTKGADGAHFKLQKPWTKTTS